MRAFAVFLGCAILVAPAFGQTLDFQTVYHSDAPVPTGAAGGVNGVTQIVLQDDTNAIATLGAVAGNFAIVYSSPSGGGYDTSLIAQAGDAIYGGGGLFADLQNVALTAGAGETRITFIGQSSGFGIFQYDVDGASPEHRVLFDGDTFQGNPFDFNAGLIGGVAHQVHSDGRVLFRGSTVAADYLVSGNGSAAGALVDDSQPETDVLSFGLSSPRWAFTPSGGAVFIAEHEYEAGQTRTDVVSVASALAEPGVRFAGGTIVDGKAYTPTFVYGATNNDTLFRAEANDGSQAVIIVRGGDHKVLGSYDGVDVNLMRADGIITEDRKVALYIPNAAGGSVVFYDAEDDGPISVVAAIGTDVNDDLNPLEIKEISVFDSFAPMVNDNGIVVFDAKVAVESGPASGDAKDALLAWWPGLTHPIVVAKVDDLIEVDGATETISAILPTAINPLVDGSIYKDGLNNSNYLAFGVGYEDNVKLAVLMVQIPEPTMTTMMLAAAVSMVGMRRRVG